MTKSGTLRSRSTELMKLPTRPWPTSTTWSLRRRRADRLAHRHLLFRAPSARRRLGERLLAARRIDVERGEQQRIEQNGDDGAGEDEVAALLAAEPPSCSACDRRG